MRENNEQFISDKDYSSQIISIIRSGKTDIESGMRFRRKGVPMGIPGLDEWHIQQTDEQTVRAARTVLGA